MAGSAGGSLCDLICLWRLGERSWRVQVRILPSAKIRRKYNEIAEICWKTETPVFLTKNGEEDMVAVSVERFFAKEQQVLLREQLVDIEKERRSGKKDHSTDAVFRQLQEMIENYQLLQLTQENEYPEREEK